MALASNKRSTTCELRRKREVGNGGGAQFNYCTRAIGRKRVACDGLEVLATTITSPSNNNTTSVKRRGSRKKLPLEERSQTSLESLPQDILVRILCCVNHSDIGPLLNVSKTVREAALIAKRTHFAFHTPLSKPVFRKAESFDYKSEGEAPNAPKQTRSCKSPIQGKRLSGIVLQLFNDEEDSC